jgi:ceramide glucosyltransferase
MAALLTMLLVTLAALGIALLAVQVLCALGHLKKPVPEPTSEPFISILKPLCGVDDCLLSNLETFGQLAYPRCEVLLGVRDTRDAAYAIACQVAARYPQRMRVVVQRGEPGLNPKVNQLITLTARARHDLLVISDSNVAVHPRYLHEIAAYFEDDSVGLVTHPIAGIGERSWGSLFDNVHLSVGIGPGMIAANQIAKMPLVVGKSMAFRRRELSAIGGFFSLKDVLAEDYVMGRWVAERCGKRVVVARRPIMNVSCQRTLRSFIERYARWSVLQRTSVGSLRYMGMVLLNPLPFMLAAFVLTPSRSSLLGLVGCACIKALLEAYAVRAVRPGGFSWLAVASMPIKDGLLLLTWSLGLIRSEVRWRGRRLAVLEGTRLVPIEAGTGRFFARRHAESASRAG